MADIFQKVIEANDFNRGSAVVSIQTTGRTVNQILDPAKNVTAGILAQSGVLDSRFDDIAYYGGGSSTGYEYTGGFLERTTGQTGASEEGDNFSYTSDMASSGIWKRFGFDLNNQVSNDSAYWTDPTPLPTSGVGLFGGLHLPQGVDSVFDFGYSDATFSPSGATNTGEIYTAADGSFDFSDLEPGSFVQVRFDFNVLPQVANTTVETALIWQTRDADDNPTLTFALTSQPARYGLDSVGQTFLNRPVLTAYFASEEDVNARALLAIRSNALVQIQPLATLCVVTK